MGKIEEHHISLITKRKLLETENCCSSGVTSGELGFCHQPPIGNIRVRPSATDTTIHAESHQPCTHKIAAHNSFINGLLNVPLEPEDLNKELKTIKFIAQQNGYQPNIIERLLKKHQIKKPNEHPTMNTDIQDKKYVSAVTPISIIISHHYTSIAKVNT